MLFHQLPLKAAMLFKKSSFIFLIGLLGHTEECSTYLTEEKTRPLGVETHGHLQVVARLSHVCSEGNIHNMSTFF